MMDCLDAHWPESVGHVNLSAHFVAKFKVSLLQAVNVAHTSAMHALLRALRVPSDYVRTVDTLTPTHGDPLLVHISVITDLVKGMLQPVLLDLALLTQDSTVKVCPPSTEQDPLSDLQPSRTDDCDILKYHSPAKVADKVIETERRYLVDMLPCSNVLRRHVPMGPWSGQVWAIMSCSS